MYHIKDDLRAEKSAELLYAGLRQCMEKKPFDKVKILDITKESTVSRATFYRNFDAVIDILYWKCDQLFQTVLGDYVAGQPSLKQEDGLIRYVFTFWMQHTDILEILIEQGRIDIIYNSFLNNANIVMDYISSKVEIPAFNYKYFISTRVGVFIGVFQTWIENGKQETADELIHILNSQMQVVEDTGFIF